MRYFFVLAFFAGTLLVDCSSSKNKGSDVLAAKDLKPIGRSALTNDQYLELISSAVHFSFSFEGKECRLYVSLPANGTDHNYIQYEMDGVYQKRIRIARDSSTAPIILTTPTEGEHAVTIYKATEAHTGPIFIQRITGNKLKPIAVAQAPLIEFIGNSITCGAAADPSETPCGIGVYHDQHNGYYAYGPRVGRALQLNYILSSVSGIGIYRNWNSDGPAMPQVYEKTDFMDQSSRYWDFKTYDPKIVSIALGTNDLSNGDGKRPRLPFDSAVYVRNYISFVRLVKSKYPNTQIALLSSPMIGGERRVLLQNCLSAVKKDIDGLFPSSKPVAVYFFKPMIARGCGGHPSVEDHAIMADELVPFFRNLL